MQYVNISGKKRNIGKKVLETIRLSGEVPCILYGKNINIPFSTSLDTFKKLLYTQEFYWVSIQIEGEKKNIKAVKKEIQFDPISEKILHADFCKIEDCKPIILEIPIKTFGRPIGVSKGGEYYSPIRKLKVKAIPSSFPKYIKLDIQSLDIGDRITVKDLLKKEYNILHPLNTLLARVKTSRIISTTDDVVKSSQDEKKDLIPNPKEDKKVKK
ncbi:50S ribosomal protein L25 [Blattabacterium cuenoti]|uniref:50S ribosomal protein L25 n=1 Tax=Blattabacterium cuenoti TaxID=1653831 RepID=UPI00163C64A3|nr:50S ribosomal protein L25 [Blattabacterium cuenoti]